MDNCVVTTLPRGVWIARVEGAYRTWTSRELATKILALGREVAAFERYDPVTRQAADLIVGEQLRIAQSEMRRRLAGRFA